MVGIKPPSPQKIWRFSSAHFSGKQFPKQTICGTIFARAMMQQSVIMVVIQTGKYHRERAEDKSHISNPAYISKTNLIFF